MVDVETWLNIHLQASKIPFLLPEIIAEALAKEIVFIGLSVVQNDTVEEFKNSGAEYTPKFEQKRLYERRQTIWFAFSI